MSNAQGPDWEREVRADFWKHGFLADRRPKYGEKGESDLWVGSPVSEFPIPILAYKRLGKLKEGQKRRQPDGERRVAVVPWEDFLQLLSQADPHGRHVTLEVQCKWAQQVNVTRVLGQLADWLRSKGRR